MVKVVGIPLESVIDLPILASNTLLLYDTMGSDHCPTEIINKKSTEFEVHSLDERNSTKVN
jgi:hypothetical protein